MLVREKMTRDIITISVSDSVAKADKIMQQNNIHHLPVLSGSKLSGMLSKSDMECFKQNNKGANLDNFNVKDAVPAHQRLVTIVPDASIEQAVMLLQNDKIGALPVMKENTMIGIITLTDVLNTFVDLLWAKRSRITVELGPEPGLIADITSAISSFGVSILRIVMFPQPEQNSFEALISLDTENIKPIVEKLREKGYLVSSYIN